MKPLIPSLIAACALMLGTLAPSTASAQSSVDPDSVFWVVTSYTTFIYGLPVTSAIGTTVGVVWLIVDSKTQVQVDNYLANNPAEVRQALALGSGAAVTDLAHMFGISSDNRDAFGTLLRTHRAALTPMATGTRDAKGFIDHLKRHILLHPRLSKDALEVRQVK